MHSVDLVGVHSGSLREACGLAVTEMARDLPDVVVLDADVAGGTGFHHFRKTYPDRFIQCGIAEQNMVAMAAGMADFGYIPVISTYAIFSCMRALEMVRNAIVLPRLNVKITGSHVGVDAGPDGATHQCIEDIGIMRSLPGLVMLSPADSHDMKGAVQAMLEYEGPVYLRTGRSPVPEVHNGINHPAAYTIGKVELLEDGIDVCLVATGVMVSRCLEARKALETEGFSAAVVNMRCLKPVDQDLLVHMARKTGAFVTVEDHNTVGGLGALVAESLSRAEPVPIEMVGLSDCFAESGQPEALAKKYGLTASEIVLAAKRVMGRKRK